MLATWLSALVLGEAAVPKVTLDYASFRGLEVKVGDVVVIEGSGFQYYEKGWKQGYYSSAWKPVDVYKGANGVITVRSNSDDGRVANTQVFTPTATGFKLNASFRWRGKESAMLEYTLGRLWAPYVDQGSLSIDGAAVPMLDKPVAAGSTFEQRRFGAGNRLEYTAPAGVMTIQASPAAIVMDGRNYTVEWADGKELFWMGYTDQELKPEQTVSFECEFSFAPAQVPANSGLVVDLKREPLGVAQSVDLTPTPIVPKPKSVEKRGGFLDATGGFKVDGPVGFAGEAAWFDRYLAGSWVYSPKGSPLPIRVGIAPGITKANGYILDVSAAGVTIVGQSLEGARYGLRTLAQVITARNGRLVVPHLKVTDWPSAQWRGAHLFVGPAAKAFQGKLSDRVFAPIKLNKIVLQCERTTWKSLSGIETGITMKQSDLVDLVGHYRSMGFEFIPLIQSLGHMEWFFANNQNKDIAVNPKVPYTLDVRKARAREVITALWDEAVKVTKPNVLHFGLDEIDMRGIEDKNLTTRLWGIGLPIFQEISKKYGTDSMVWGDMLLAKGEAVDACHAPSLEAAKTRRNMLKKGTYIADWHYRDDPNPDTFDSSLKLWNELGLRPIASTWFRPGNIRGFTLSAIRNNAGILQTTWAGYESNEFNFVREFPQFAAFIMMADYAWSGRTEMPNQLGYDPQALLQKWYFGGPQAVSPRSGEALVGNMSDEMQIGPFKFLTFEAHQLYGVTSQRAIHSPNRLTIPVDAVASELVLAVDCLATVTDTELAARAVVHYVDGSQEPFDLRYGAHVRSIRDKRATMAAPRKSTLSAVRIATKDKRVKSIELVAAHSAAGLRLHGLTVLQ
jgi:hypothetical protein